MADRVSVYSDPRVIAATDDFVCAADEVWRLQRGSEPDCVFFQEMVTGGDRITDRGTRQGSWVIAPSGMVLARVNTRDVDKQLEMMERGLAAWAALRDDQRRLPDDTGFDTMHRYEDFRPDDGLVLERIARDVDEDGLDGTRGRRWNRDHAWASRDELSAWMRHGELAVGDVLDWAPLAERLARFHVVDNAGGQTIPYAREDVERAELVARVVARDGARVTFELTGATRCDSDGTWHMPFSEWKPLREFPHGIASTLVGRATWDADAERFDDFELVAVARRWGRTENNARGRGPDVGLVAFHFQPGDSRVPPAFASVYDAPWLEHPDVGNWLLSPAECGLPER